MLTRTNTGGSVVCMKPRTVMLTEETVQALEQIRTQERVPVTEQLRLAVEFWLQHRQGPPPLTDHAVDAFLQAEPETPDRARAARVRARFEARKAASEPHTVGTEPPTRENDPVGRFQPVRVPVPVRTVPDDEDEDQRPPWVRDGEDQ